MPQMFQMSYSINFGLRDMSQCVQAQDAIRSIHNMAFLSKRSQSPRKPSLKERRIHAVLPAWCRSQEELTEIVTTMHFEYPRARALS